MYFRNKLNNKKGLTSEYYKKPLILRDFRILVIPVSIFYFNLILHNRVLAPFSDYESILWRLQKYSLKQLSLTDFMLERQGSHPHLFAFLIGFLDEQIVRSNGILHSLILVTFTAGIIIVILKSCVSRGEENSREFWILILLIYLFFNLNGYEVYFLPFQVTVIASITFGILSFYLLIRYSKTLIAVLLATLFNFISALSHGGGAASLLSFLTLSLIVAFKSKNHLIGLIASIESVLYGIYLLKYPTVGKGPSISEGVNNILDYPFDSLIAVSRCIGLAITGNHSSNLTFVIGVFGISLGIPIFFGIVIAIRDKSIDETQRDLMNFALFVFGVIAILQLLVFNIAQISNIDELDLFRPRYIPFICLFWASVVLGISKLSPSKAIEIGIFLLLSILLTWSQINSVSLGSKWRTDSGLARSLLESHSILEKVPDELFGLPLGWLSSGALKYHESKIFKYPSQEVSASQECFFGRIEPLGTTRFYFNQSGDSKLKEGPYRVDLHERIVYLRPEGSRIAGSSTNSYGFTNDILKLCFIHMT